MKPREGEDAGGLCTLQVSARWQPRALTCVRGSSPHLHMAVASAPAPSCLRGPELILLTCECADPTATPLPLSNRLTFFPLLRVGPVFLSERFRVGLQFCPARPVLDGLALEPLVAPSLLPGPWRPPSWASRVLALQPSCLTSQPGRACVQLLVDGQCESQHLSQQSPGPGGAGGPPARRRA